MTGTQVRGRRVDHVLAVESAASDVQTLGLGADKGIADKAFVLAFGTLGPQKTAVILVNFSNNPVQPYTAAAARDVVFGTTNSFDLENSYGQTSVTGDVFDWYTIPAHL